MPNVNAPRGLTPVRYASGAPYNGAVNRYYVPAADATALFIGDPVTESGSADANGVPTATRTAAGGGNRWTGVVVGIETPKDPTKALMYRPASTEAYILVADDPNLLFEIQDDSVGGALAAADFGLNADFIAAAGSTFTGRSGFMLDTSTKAVTATLQMRIESLAQRPDNEIGANAKVLVRNNLPTKTGAAGALGV